MTALAEEIEEAQTEGATILPLAAPVRIETDENGPRLRALWMRRRSSAVGKDGRPRPNVRISRGAAHRARPSS